MSHSREWVLLENKSFSRINSPRKDKIRGEKKSHLNQTDFQISREWAGENDKKKIKHVLNPNLKSGSRPNSHRRKSRVCFLLTPRCMLWEVFNTEIQGIWNMCTSYTGFRCGFKHKKRHISNKCQTLMTQKKQNEQQTHLALTRQSLKLQSHTSGNKIAFKLRI